MPRRSHRHMLPLVHQKLFLYMRHLLRREGPGRWLSILLFVVAAVVALGGIGISAFLYLHPPLQPAITVTSDYKVGSTPAGAVGTVFHVSGQQFSNSSNVTFLLDGTPISNPRIVQTDASGNIKTDLAVTEAWTAGQHTLTAKDAQNNVTKAGMNVVIVPQGTGKHTRSKWRSA